MTMTNPKDDMLDDLFATARTQAAPPNADLRARVLSDAQQVQAGFGAVAAPSRAGLWLRLMDALGGWPAVSGLAAATVAGVWIGIAPPSSIEDLTAGLLGDEVSVSLMSTSLGFDEGTFFDG